VGCAFATRLKEWISRLKLSSQKGGEIIKWASVGEKKEKETRGSGRKKIFFFDSFG
jgi:hypothetical protein